jgi:hypothetical protein
LVEPRSGFLATTIKAAFIGKISQNNCKKYRQRYAIHITSLAYHIIFRSVKEHSGGLHPPVFHVIFSWAAF